MAANRITVETCAQDNTCVVECDLIPLPDRLPVTWLPSSDIALPLESNPLTAVEARTQNAVFVTRCSLTGLHDRLPLAWPAPPDTPPSPKKTYCSHYVYLGWEDLNDPAAWDHLSNFDLVLRLVDFSSLRPVLAQRLGWTSARGWTPFDPVSIFLPTGWQITNDWNRAETLRHLCDPRYADYA